MTPTTRCELCGNPNACMDCHFHRHYESSSMRDSYAWTGDENPVEAFMLSDTGKVHLRLITRPSHEDGRGMCGRGRGRSRP